MYLPFSYQIPQSEEEKPKETPNVSTNKSYYNSKKDDY